MNFKLFLNLALLSVVFSGMTQAQGRAKLSQSEVDNRKQLYLKSKEYKKLSPGMKSLVSDFLFKTQKIDGDTYRLSILDKGAGRENELTLRCAVEGKMKTLSQLLASERPMTKAASNFQDWLKYQAFDTKGRWVGAKVVGDLCPCNRPVVSTSVVKSLVSPVIYTHSLKPNIQLLKAAQAKQAFYGNLLDGLSTKKLAIAENISTQGVKTATEATVKPVMDAVKSTVHKTVATNIAAVAKMGKYAIPAVAVTGAAALAYKYGFVEKPAQQPVVEEKPLSKMTQFSNLCANNPATTMGATAAIAALGYGAYKLYNSTESKKEVSEVQ